MTGEAVETATIGPEGMAGIPAFLDADQMSCQTFCQVPGRAYRLPVAAFRAEIDRSDELRRLLSRYVVAFHVQTSQTSACTRLHSMRERCARWLLHTHDRVNGGTFALTQEFLAQMMGVRRATVSEVAAGLQRDGLIEYSYRQITVLDRVGLEAAACECYRIITAEYDLNPEDPDNYRLAFYESFKQWGIFPEGMANMSMETLLWSVRPPVAAPGGAWGAEILAVE